MRRFAKIPWRRLACAYCGNECELAHTTDDCCSCFDEHSQADIPWCAVCQKRLKDKELRAKWLKENTMPLTDFLHR